MICVFVKMIYVLIDLWGPLNTFSSRLYLVEVLLHIIDVLLHFISILLQLLDQTAQFCRWRTERHRHREINSNTVCYNHTLSLFPIFMNKRHHYCNFSCVGILCVITTITAFNDLKVCKHVIQNVNREYNQHHRDFKDDSSGHWTCSALCNWCK